jgi:hypothetical protein
VRLSGCWSAALPQDADRQQEGERQGLAWGEDEDRSDGDRDPLHALFEVGRFDACGGDSEPDDDEHEDRIGVRRRGAGHRGEERHIEQGGRDHADRHACRRPTDQHRRKQPAQVIQVLERARVRSAVRQDRVDEGCLGGVDEGEQDRDRGASPTYKAAEDAREGHREKQGRPPSRPNEEQPQHRQAGPGPPQRRRSDGGANHGCQRPEEVDEQSERQHLEARRPGLSGAESRRGPHAPPSTPRPPRCSTGHARGTERDVAARRVAPERHRGLRPLRPQASDRGSSCRVREGGLEPPCPFGHTALNRARLPFPPLARGSSPKGASDAGL